MSEIGNLGKNNIIFTNNGTTLVNLTATSDQLTLNGSGLATPVLISQVATPVDPTDAANKDYVDTHGGGGGGDLTGPISATGGTTSITAQTGTGTVFVVNTSPTLITPNIGAATGISLGVSGGVSGNQITSTIATGTPPFVVASTTQVANLKATSAATSDTTTTNANLTGPITSVGNATSVASQTGTGTTFVMNTAPTLVTPNIGAATGTSLSVSGSVAGSTLGATGAITGASLGVTGGVSGNQLTSTVATGTPPLVVSSTTQVPNLKSTSAATADNVITNANLTGPITSVGNATSVASQTGTGTTFVMNTSPTLVTPDIGAATGTSLNATGGVSGDQLTSTIATGTPPLVVSSSTQVPNLKASRAAIADTVTTNANLTGPITSVGNATSVASQTGTGSTFVMNTSPTLVTPNIGAATGTSLGVSGAITSASLAATGDVSGNQLTSTIATGTPPLVVSSTTQVANLKATSAATADTVITNANLTGPITSVGNATSVASQTGTGTTFVMNTSPTLVTPNIGAATGTSLNTTGIITTAAQLISTIATGTSPFVVSSTTQVANLYATRAATADTVTTNANLTGPITSVGNATSVASQTGTGSTFVMNTSPTINNLNANSTIISNVLTPLTTLDAANKDYVDSLTAIASYKVIVQKNPNTGEFSTIEDALASITTASATELWTVEVGPGIYDENQLIVPNYVSIKGSTIQTTIVQPIVPNQYLFVMGTSTELSFLSLYGIAGSVSPGAGAGYAAVYCNDVGDYAQLHKLSIYDFDIAIDNYSNTTSSILYVEYTDVNGDFSYGTRNRSVNGFQAKVVLEDYFSYESNSVIQTSVLNDGAGALIQFTGSSFYGNAGMKCIVAQNGGELLIGAILIQDFGAGGVISLNTGAGAVIKIDGTTFDNCTPDFSIENTGTTGYFFGNSPRDNHYIINGSTFFVANQDSNIINVAKRGGDYTSIKDAVDSITDASPTNIYLVKIGPGIFVENTITLSPGIFVLGYFLNATTIVPTNSNSTVVVLSDLSYIKDVYITGATGVNGIAISFQGSIGLGTLVRDCAFGNNTTNVSVFGNTVSTLIVIDRCSILGNCTECIVVTNNSGIQTRVTVDNTFYRDLAVPVCTNFLRAAGVGVTINIVSTLVLVATVAGNKAFLLDDGVDFKITGSSITGFDNAIYVPTGVTNACAINGSGTLINNSGTYDIYIGTANTLGSWTGETSYTKVYIPDNCPFYISAIDPTIITVQKSGGNFTSIVSALAAITDATSLKRYIIKVGAGTFTEAEIVMKLYVSIQGSGRSTVITPDANNHHIIRSCDYVELTSMILTGAGTGYAAIYHETPTGTSNTALICRGILLGINDIHVWTYGDVGTSHVILYNSRYGGTAQFNKGFLATNNNNSVDSEITIIGTTSQDFTSPLPQYIGYASGDNCKISVNSFNAIYEGTIEANTYGFKVDNGGFIRLIGCAIKGFDTAVYSINSGAAPTIVASALTINNCTTDLNIDHPTTIGSIDGSASRLKTLVNGTPPITLFIIDPADSGIAFSGPFYYSNNNFNDVQDISNLITNTPTMGVISGGTLTIDSGLTIKSAAGSGYNENADVLKYQTWTDTTLLLPADSNVYVYINSSGIFTAAASIPDTESNILLGLVSTNATDIIYIQQTPLNAHHWSNNTDLMLRTAIGPIYSSGSSVAEFGTRELTVSQGVYFFSSKQFLPGGGSPVTFTIYYRSATPGIYTSIASQTTVPNGFYDDGSGTLAALTPTFYTKHLLLLLGGPSETYALVYGQAEYVSQGAAEAAGLPVVPSFVTDAFVRVVSIVVQEGTTNIISFIDERPRIGFASSSTTGVITVHGDLLGLAANDHPQYLLVDGSAPGMTGNLVMNGNQITGAGLINSVDIAAHGSRHGLNASDPLPTPTLSSDIADISGTAASIGISNTVPRSDHVHFHGNLAGGNLHAAVIAAGASGFMTGADKTKLDGIASGATNTTASNTAPVNVTKAAASAGVSAEVSRYDHKHDVSTAAPITTLLTSTTNAEGSATTLARSDHTHAISSDVPVAITPDEAIAIGNSTAFARADHIHNIPTGIAAGLTATSTNTQGAAATFARSNHTHAIASGVPSNQTIALAVATGTSTNFARADHLHTFSTAAPSTIDQANTEGASTSFARADHIHDHGSQTNPTNHAVVTITDNGFMSSTDKTKLDTITLGGSLTFSGAYNFTGTLTNTTAVTFPTSGTLATTSQLVVPAALTKADDTNVTLTLGGSPSTALVNAASITAGWTGQLGLTRGGTNNTLTASNGGIIWSDASKLNILSGTATANQLLISGASGTPAWTTSTYPSTNAVNTLLYASSINTMAALATANNGVLVTSAGGVPSIGSTLPSAVQGNITSVGTVSSGTWNGSVIGEIYGGTNQSTYTLGDTLYSSATNVLSKLAGNTTTTKQFLSQTGTGTISDAPVWSTVSASDITGAALTKTDDTNVTLTLGGTPSTALLRAASITAGWTGLLSSARGGTGVNNGSNTLTLGGNLTTSGAFSSTFTMTALTAVTFPTTGTLATTSQLPTPAALTKVDDTNVTLTLGGTPSTALLQATSITAGWTGTLSATRGGTGVNNGSNTLTLGGNLTTSGAFSSTFTMTNTTAVTFPTTGTLATTSQLPTPAALTKTDDTNVTLTLGGTPATALLQATSITAGWTGVLSGARGGTGVNNGGNTLTLGGNLTTSGAFASTFTMTALTAVTFPTTGTLATTSQLPTPAALTKVDDTNVTLTLGGTPSTALLQATSITAGWTGVLSATRGGTGVNNGSNTLTLGGNLTTSGAFASTFTMTALTAVTFPTTGTLATTSQLPTPAALTKTDDTNVTLTLGGTPSTALLQATSITAGWTGVLSSARGGTGVNNGSSSLTLGGNLTTSGAFASTFTMTALTAVTFPTTGTLATTSQLPTPSALTKTDDTNVTLTLGGTPATALLQATSITAGWTGVLSSTRGGTGVNNGSNTLTLGGNLTTSGAFNSTFTMTALTAVTFPTTGTLATTSQLPTPAALTKADDTNVTLTLGGTPATALLQATSITAGWTGVLSGTRGGTGVNNGANTITLGGSLTTSGSFASTFTMTNTTAVTFPTTGTLATTSQLPTPAALTEVDDTNVTLTLGGTPSTALLQATSITAGWTGTLSGTRGGTGVNNGASTITLGGSLTTSGAFATTFTMSAATAVTFPPAGVIYAGTKTANTALQSQVTVAGTSYYVTSSGLLVPGASIRIGTRFNWTVSMTKTNAGTGAFRILIYMGTNGTTADTALVTQSIGTQTAAVDNVLINVQVCFTAVGAGTGSMFWSITPSNKAVTATGFGCVTGTLFSGTVGSLTTTTSALILGLGFVSVTGTPTITVPLVQGQLYI